MDQLALKRLCEFGLLYSPAWKHYDDNDNDGCHLVMCDNCFKDNLDISCGFEELDICIDCYNEFKKNNAQTKSFEIFCSEQDSISQKEINQYTKVSQEEVNEEENEKNESYYVDI